MRLGYFDCFSGASGDMILGVLVDVGCPLDRLRAVVARLNLPGVTLEAEKVKRHGIAGTKLHVNVAPEAKTKHRHLPQIERIIDAADLAAEGFTPRVAERAKAVFRRLAEAEAQVHGTSIDKVHFHEVGANDAIVDIVAACAGVEALGLPELRCSPIPVGNGTVECEHGVMPVPAPATALLLRGIPIAASEETGELTTPTGAALLTTLCSRFEPLPAMRVSSVGYGAGTREGKSRPNLLRLIFGEVDAAAVGESAESDEVVVLEAQLDDADGQSVADAAQRLLDAGALDVFIVPIIMKKGRPGQLLTVLAEPPRAAEFEDMLLRDTPTFGVRRQLASRAKLARRYDTVSTPFGEIRVKVGERDGRVLQAWPEYEECAAAANRAGVPLREVRATALAAWSKEHRRG